MSTPDKNLLNFYSPQDDGKSLDYREVTLSPPDDSYSGIIKATTNVWGLRIRCSRVIGARETACDVNNGARDCEFRADTWDVSACLYGFSNKGGSTGNTFIGRVVGSSKECEFFQDNWSDQSHRPSSAHLNLWRDAEGVGPIRIRYLYNKPTLEPGSGPYKFLFPQPWIPLPRSWLAKIFNQLRRWGLFR